MEKQKILFIEDDPDVVELVRIALEANLYEFYSAPNGTLGLKKVKEIRPDLIILDIMMETLTDGFHVSYNLKNKDPKSEYYEFSRIPIIMLTGIPQKMHMDFAPETDGEYLPVEDFLEKPIRIDALLEKIRKLIS